MADQKKGIGSRLGGLFFKESSEPVEGPDDSTSSRESPASDNGDKPVFGRGTSSEQAIRPTARRLIAADQEIVAKIKSKIEGETHEAYEKFNELLEELRDIVPDEGARMKAALVSMKRLGFDERMVVGIYDARIEAVDSFASEFDEAHKRRVEDISRNSADEISKLDQSIKGFESEITSLTQKLLGDKSRRAQLERETEGSVRELTSKGSQTKTAIDAVRQEFQHERDAVSRLIS